MQTVIRAASLVLSFAILIVLQTVAPQRIAARHVGRPTADIRLVIRRMRHLQKLMLAGEILFIPCFVLLCSMVDHRVLFPLAMICVSSIAGSRAMFGGAARKLALFCTNKEEKTDA